MKRWSERDIKAVQKIAEMLQHSEGLGITVHNATAQWATVHSGYTVQRRKIQIRGWDGWNHYRIEIVNPVLHALENKYIVRGKLKEDNAYFRDRFLRMVYHPDGLDTDREEDMPMYFYTGRLGIPR